MGNRDGILRLILTGVFCASIIVYAAINGLFDGNNKNIIFTESQKLTDIYDIPANGSIYTANIIETEIKNESSEEQVTSSETAVESQPAASDGAVLGKIIEKFITPYTANTSYGKVYLKNSTGLSIDIKELLSSPINFKIQENSEPQVLIMHTHTTESYMLDNRNYYTENDKSRRTDENYNNVRLGKIVTDKLNAAGIATLHDTTMHDYPEYNGSYDRSNETVKGYLKKYPSIKIVIDMHRDAVASGSDKIKLVTEIGGKKAAQVMLVMGSQSGSTTNYPNWKENLKLAVRLQQKLEEKYPTLARSINLCSRNYNQSLTTGSMLIEMGTDANNIDEMSYSAELLGNTLIELLKELE